MRAKERSRASLAGKVAVVSGASRGIGLAIAKALADRGCRLAITARKSQSLQKAARALKAKVAHPADVTDEHSVRNFFDEVKRAFGRVDILINNAGTAHALRNVEDLPVETWREVIDTNLTGAFLCTRAALPLMGEGGVIVNNLSVAAPAFAGESAYCASKQGLLGFTNTLRLEVRERGIRVVALFAGPTDTDIWNQFMPDAPREQMMSPETVARVLVDAISVPANTVVQEIHLGPIGGTI